MTCGGCRQNPKVKVTVPTTAPQIMPDGTIEFPEGPAPTIEGYTVDPDDENVLVPIGQTCSLRIMGMMLQKDGTYKPYYVCRNSACKHKSKQVTIEICDTCPHLTN